MTRPSRAKPTPIERADFLIWRIQVSLLASSKYGWPLGEWGFADDEGDLAAFRDGMAPDEYFCEAWGRP